MEKFKELMGRVLSDCRNYRLAINDENKFVVERHFDPYRNGFPRWVVIETPETVITALVAESKQYDLPLDDDGAMVFNYELWLARKTLLKEHEDRLVEANKERFKSHYQAMTE